jgi:hypothetical protein
MRIRGYCYKTKQRNRWIKIEDGTNEASWFGIALNKYSRETLDPCGVFTRSVRLGK